MSESMYQSRVNSLRRELAQLEKGKAAARADEARLRGQATKARSDSARTTSDFTRKSKTREADTKERAANQAADKAADAEKKIAAKSKALNDAQGSLDRVRADAARREAAQAQRERREREREVAGLRAKVAGLERGQEVLQGALRRVLPDTITVLVVFTDPARNLNLPEEARSIHHVLRLSEHRDHIRLETRWAARAGDLSQALIDTHPTVVHISGHGTPDGALVFQGDDGQPRLIAADALGGLIAALGEQVRVVLLNACYSEQAASATAPFVEAAIGMDVALEDEAARRFAEGLYRGIGAGESLAHAFAAALFEYDAELSGRSGSRPVLFAAQGVDPAEVLLVAPPEERSA